MWWRSGGGISISFNIGASWWRKVPRVNCPRDGVRLSEVPWASAESGFTLLFEAMVMLLAAEMPISDVAQIMGEQDTRLWRLLLAAGRQSA